jgi:hypothetical protein
VQPEEARVQGVSPVGLPPRRVNVNEQVHAGAGAATSGGRESVTNAKDEPCRLMITKIETAKTIMIRFIKIFPNLEKPE